MHFIVEPGLYALNQPDDEDPVLVTANYKMTFDILRRDLAGVSAWIMVLDSKGVNVWCAAGKGTFGTQELVERIQKVKLGEHVKHRRLILPQLGAPGIAAHAVRELSGYSCTFGPVRSADLPAYLGGRCKVTEQMRQVDFPVSQRLALVPMELVPAVKVALPVFGAMFLLNLFLSVPFGFPEFVAYGGTIIVGCLLVPLLLPMLPGRAFCQKGFIVGLGWAWLLIEHILPLLGFGPNLWQSVAYILLLPALAAVYAVLFTGSTPITSLAGVQRELRLFFPFLFVSLILGIVLTLVWRL